MKDNITVSVIMITYAHEKYIQQAINGVLMQNVNFHVELIIADDCSKDDTESIVSSYSNHPNFNWIKYTKHRINKGMMPNFIWSLKQAKGKYIALCEGDDYWIDQFKLQKQVDFLENNSKYVCCITESIVGDNINQSLFTNISTYSDISSEQILVESNFATNTIVFINNIINSSLNLFIESPLGDTLALYLLSLHGRIKFIPVSTGFYRKHIGGVYTGSDSFVKTERQIFFLKLLLDNKFLKHEKLIQRLISSMYLDLAYNYAYKGYKLKTFSIFRRISILHYFYNLKKLSKIILHLIFRYNVK